MSTGDWMLPLQLGYLAGHVSGLSRLGVVVIGMSGLGVVGISGLGGIGGSGFGIVEWSFWSPEFTKQPFCSWSQHQFLWSADQES
mmetsp:Transcript_5485/g.15875  ORF Transcript_5485/g.15875 Transcript_5485/m.15875 type:complete len:85 (-) Transcript_5485:332-586(-)